MTLEQESIEFMKSLQNLYYEKREMETLYTFLDQKISWIGTGAHEMCRNLKEAVSALQLERDEYAGAFLITSTDYHAVNISDSVCVVYGELSAQSGDPEIADLHNRISAVCCKTKDGMRLLHLHVSRSDCDQADGRFYVKQEDNESREMLQDRARRAAYELNKRNLELETMTENIPGGVHQCLNDSGLTLLNMTKSFLSLVGYSREEILSRFGNCFANMIIEEDRADVLQALHIQMKYGDTLEFEYRVRCGDGKIRWILDKGKVARDADGRESIYCMLLDITARRRAQEALRLSLERHKIIMNQATDIIIEWNMRNDTLLFSPNWQKKFQYEPLRRHISKEIPKSPHIHPEDIPSVMGILHNAVEGIPYNEAEVRIRDITENYIWCKIRATTQYNEEHIPIKAVGVIIDIDEDKKQRQRLLELAQRDSLTGLLNKSASRLRIEEALKNSSTRRGILFILDLDDFKGINDRYGHLCGDAVLTDTASELKRLFRSSDILGRIGGDEFLIYLPEFLPEKAKKKADEIIQALSKIPLHMGEKLTCSIGSALFPTDAEDFYGLYHCADRALYHVKNDNKSGYAAFNPNMFGEERSISSVRTSLGTTIDSDLGSVDERLGQYVFRMLYQAINVKTAVDQILEIVGHAYDVSRVYIFESSKDGLYCSNTFEWCNENVSSEMERLQKLSYQGDWGNYFSNFDENHVFYCRDIRQVHPGLYEILAPQGICSLLQCAIIDDGIFKGFVGFDECRKNRYWMQEQIDSLSLIANVLSTFLMKYRLKEHLNGLLREQTSPKPNPDLPNQQSILF